MCVHTTCAVGTFCSVPSSTPPSPACPRAPGHFNVVQLLDESDADINARSTFTEWTPLHFAAYYGWADGVDILLQAGAKVKDIIDGGRSRPNNKAVLTVPLDIPPPTKRSTQRTTPGMRRGTGR